MTDETRPQNSLPGWSTIFVARKPCEVFQPPTPNPHNFALIYLHGLNKLKLVDNPVFTAEFSRHAIRVIAPRTGPCWWADRICPEFDQHITPQRHVVDNVLQFLGEHWKVKPPNIGLLGTSMGGQGALRIAFKHPSKFPVTAAISPAIDYQVRWNEGDEMLQQMYSDPEAVRQDTATLHVHPLNWPRHIWFCCDPVDHLWHESAERLRSKLVALGIPHEHDLETSGGGHSFTYYNRMAPVALNFIVEQLLQESRCVV